MDVKDARDQSAASALPNTIRMLPVRLLDCATPSDLTAVRGLFDSILQWGILQPLIVRRGAGGVRYDVLAGCKRLASAASAGLSEVPCLVFEGSETDAAAIAAAANVAAPAPPVPSTTPLPPLFAAVLSELQATRAAIAGSLRLAESNAGGLRPRVARELVDVELQHAAWILDGLRTFSSEEPDARVSVKVGPLLRSVVDAFQPECRLAGIDVRLLVEPADLSAISHDVHLRAALNCALGAVLTSMHAARQADAALLVQGAASSGTIVISIAQNVLPFQELARIRGSRRGDLPQGEALLTAFGLEAAKRLLERQGGRLELRSDAATGGAAVDLKLVSVAGIAKHPARDLPR